MRKLVSLGLFTLLLYSLSSHVAADPADGACELLNELDASPGLYGLCIAYHNANDKAKERILENYRKHMATGDPDMPGAVSCPCWDLEFAQTITSGEVLEDCGTQAGSSVDFDFVRYESKVQFSAISLGGGVMYYCALIGTSPNLNMPVSGEQDIACRQVLAELEPECIFD